MVEPLDPYTRVHQAQQEMKNTKLCVFYRMIVRLYLGYCLFFWLEGYIFLRWPGKGSNHGFITFGYREHKPLAVTTKKDFFLRNKLFNK